VVAWSDLDAVLLRGLAAQAGLRVPEDLALVGYYDSPMTAFPLVDLAGTDQSGREIGRTAAELLSSRIAGRREAQQILVAPRLGRRSSL